MNLRSLCTFASYFLLSAFVMSAPLFALPANPMQKLKAVDAKVQKRSTSDFNECLQQIRENTAVESFLSYCTNSKTEFLALLEAMQENTSIKKLYYDDSYLAGHTSQNKKHDPELLAAMIQLFEKNNSIETIYITMSGNNYYTKIPELFGPKDLQQLSAAISRSTSLSSLGLWSMKGDKDFFDAISSLFNNAENIVNITLDTDSFVDDFGHVITSLGNKKLNSLELVPRAYTDADQLAFTQAVSELLKSTISLKGLYIGANDFNPQAGQIFVDALTENKSLEALGFDRADFIDASGNYSVDNLILALENHPMLRSLYVMYVNYTPENVAKLYNYIEKSSLESLWLEGTLNPITTTEQMKPLADMIKFNMSLKELHLHYLIDRKAQFAPQISDALRANTTLKKLYLDMNYGNYDEAQAKILADVLEVNYSLITYTGPWHMLSNKDFDLFQARLKRNNRLLLDIYETSH